MLSAEELKRLKNQMMRLDPHSLATEIGLDLNENAILDEIVRGLDLLVLHRKGTME
jgi:hypothetical protein